MKRLLAIILSFSLLGSSAAMARGYQGGDYRQGDHGRSTHDRGGYGYRNDRSGDAAALGLGILALGLFATLAAQNSHDHRAYEQPRGYGYGYNPGYGYGGGYGSPYRYGR